MRLAGALLGARARRREGRPVDLGRERRANDRISGLLRVPKGVTLTEETLGGVPVVRLSSGGGARGTVLYLHGGAYALGSARQALTAAGTCADGGPDIVSVEYRLAPEHPCPAAVDDAMAVYRELIASPGPGRLVVVGESAGGGLLLLLLQRARDEGLPMPVAAVPAFPWADLSMSRTSATANLGRDLLSRSELVQEAAWFAGDRDPADPAVSPLFGSFRGFPWTWIPVGTHDLLLDDARRVAAAMTAEGVDVVLDEWPGAVHGFTALPLSEGRRYRQRLRSFVHAALAPLAAPAHPTTDPDTEESTR
jgi:acetyl esterase/lipase